MNWVFKLKGKGNSVDKVQDDKEPTKICHFLKPSFMETLTDSSSKGDCKAVVLLGDMNAEIEEFACDYPDVPKDVFGRVGAAAARQEGSNGQLFLNMCSNEGLVIGNGRGRCPSNKSTFYGTMGGKGRTIDYIAISHRWSS